MLQVKQSTSAIHFVFLMIDSTDHITGKTGLSPTVTLSKNAGSFASPSGAITEISSGWYKLAANATDSGTLGVLALHATSAGADPTDVILANIVAYDPQDAVRAGLTALPNAAANAAGGLPISSAGALDLDEMNVDIEAIQTSTAGLTFTGAGKVDASVRDWVGDTIPARNVTGVPIIDLKYVLGTVLTEGAGGRLAAAVIKFFNVAASTLTTAGIDQTGDSYARIGAPVGASISADIAEIEVETDDIAAIKTQTDKLAFTVANQVDANVLDWKSATAPAMTGDAFARLGAPVGASISADVAGVPAAVIALAYEGAETIQTFLRLARSALVGKLSGAATATVTTRDAGDTKARITATVDADGNRSAVTVDGT